MSQSLPLSDASGQANRTVKTTAAANREFAQLNSALEQARHER